MGREVGWLGGWAEEETGPGPSLEFKLSMPRSLARSSSESIKPPRPKDCAWNTEVRVAGSSPSFPGALNPTTVPRPLGCTTLTLCRLLVVPLPPPPFSSLGGFIPAHSSRNALPSSNKIWSTSLRKGLILEMSLTPPVEYPLAGTKLFDTDRPEAPRPCRPSPGGPYREAGIFSGFDDNDATSGQNPELCSGLPMGPGRAGVASDWDLLLVRSWAYCRPLKCCDGGK